MGDNQDLHATGTRVTIYHLSGLGNGLEVDAGVTSRLESRTCVKSELSPVVPGDTEGPFPPNGLGRRRGAGSSQTTDARASISPAPRRRALAAPHHNSNPARCDADCSAAKRADIISSPSAACTGTADKNKIPDNIQRSIANLRRRKNQFTDFIPIRAFAASNLRRLWFSSDERKALRDF